MDLLPPEFKKMGVFPVGRLDKDTEGSIITHKRWYLGTFYH